MRIEDVLSDRRLLDYTQQFPPQPGDMEGLFPSVKIDDFEADMVFGAYNKPVLAEMYAFDTPTELGQREGYESGAVSLNLIKEKMKLDEREIMRLRRPRSNAEQTQAIQRIYRDVEEIQNRIENRIEYMRYQAVTTGKIEYVGNGLELGVDFGVPGNHKGTLSWSDPEADVLEEMFQIKETILKDTGFAPTHMLTSTKWLYKLLKNKAIRLAILGTEKDKFITPAEMNQGLSAMGLFTIKIDEKRYATQKVVNKRVVKTFEKFLPEDTAVFLPDGSLGNTIRGLTPEGEGLRDSGIAQIEMAGQTVITHYKEVDPVAHYVKGTASAMVTFPMAEQIFIGSMK